MLNSNRNSAGNSGGDSFSAERVISIGLLFLTLAIGGIYLLRPLVDPDFFWHLKTGQWIWHNKSLPTTDLFGVPPAPDQSVRTEFIYTSYWLIQLILYAFHSMGGESGIIMLRWVIAGLSLLIFLCWADVRKSSVSAVFAIGVIQILEFYFIERPQFISFICFGVLLILIFRAVDGRAGESLWKTLVPLSLLMIVWANMHGGFIIGQAVLIYCVIAEGVKILYPKLGSLSGNNFRNLVVASLAALAASFVNPNPIVILKYLPHIFDSDHYLNQNNLEELSLFEYYRLVPDFMVLLYLISIILVFCALLVSRQRKNITWIGILVCTAFFGAQHMRIMPFFLVAAILFLARFFDSEYPAMKGRVILLVMLIVNVLFCVGDELPRIRETMRSGWIPPYQLPVQAADYIATNSIGGNIYTTMYWGGYMIWRLGPENKIFYDSRTLSTQRAWEYDNSCVVVPGYRPYWKGLFDVYNVNLVVLPCYEDDGQPNLLALSIYEDPGWTNNFANEFEMVFTRKVQAQPVGL